MSMEMSDEDYFQRQRYQDAAYAIQREKERKAYLFEHGFSEEDVYGRHASGSFENQGVLSIWHVPPKGMIRYDLVADDKTVAVHSNPDPDYVGEHRIPDEVVD
ncbi:hypothetical protein GJ25_gp091 [Mycobacterium phage Hawkeye]|uniref:Uncharacterized protein n=1 Tax=Mycobacterium phage Hawkeye TaxID=1458711 RepID=X2KNA9_9CAUD|nr:hypothetical protein GJ25_gp091 [Mycobacterium phage Hawkeye]AHN84102.1 hypothetical protein PBI_HAWKEYE_91 [Mycobacterium phage Hawkeye]